MENLFLVLRIERASKRMSGAEPTSEANSLEQACVMQIKPGVDKLHFFFLKELPFFRQALMFLFFRDLSLKMFLAGS